MTPSARMTLDADLSFSAVRLLDLLQVTQDGAGIFELFAIKGVSTIAPYIDITSHGIDEAELPKLDLVVCKSKEASVYVDSLLSAIDHAKAEIQSDSDPAIQLEVNAILRGTHSRYRDLARTDASSASAPVYPRRSYPTVVYDILASLCNVTAVQSATFFLCNDIGLLHAACNELIFRRGRVGGVSSSLRDRPVKLGIHPDHVCWDEDGNMYRLGGWPDWADEATWFDNLPLQSDLHIMQLEVDAFEHFELIESKSRYARSFVVVLIPLSTQPRGALHPDYKWYWHQANIFVGVHNLAPAATKSDIRALAFLKGMESAAPTQLHGRRPG